MRAGTGFEQVGGPKKSRKVLSIRHRCAASAVSPVDVWSSHQHQALHYNSPNHTPNHDALFSCVCKTLTGCITMGRQAYLAKIAFVRRPALSCAEAASKPLGNHVTDFHRDGQHLSLPAKPQNQTNTYNSPLRSLRSNFPSAIAKPGPTTTSNCTMSVETLSIHALMHMLKS
jgi:hypothetical protein